MKSLRWFAVAAVVAGLPVAAAAQEPTTQPVTTTTPQMAVSPAVPVQSHWLLSGFVGSNFGRDVDEASVDFGGTLGYLWRGSLGAEFAANFTPNFQLEPARSALLLGETPSINSYMINAIGAVPLGIDGQWRPYVSGGVGALTLRSDVLSDPDGFEIQPDASRTAGNIGVGILGFAGNWGIRGDVRYFRGFQNGVDIIDTPTDEVGSQVLSELTFWRANIGLAVRF